MLKLQLTGPAGMYIRLNPSASLQPAAAPILSASFSQVRQGIMPCGFPLAPVCAQGLKFQVERIAYVYEVIRVVGVEQEHFSGRPVSSPSRSCSG